MKRATELKNLLLANRFRAHNLQAESSRLEQIDYWLDELSDRLGMTKEEATDWVFEEASE